jgi:hypothetical protein
METIGVARARAIVLGGSGFAAPAPIAGEKSPPRFVAVATGAERVRQAGMGYRSHLAHAEPRGVELVTDLLTELGVDQKAIAAWIAGELERRGLLDKRNDDSEIEAA